MNIFKTFPPDFPKSKYLAKKWWHKVIWLISFLISFSSFLSIFSILILIFQELFNLNLGFINKIITLPLVIAILPVYPFFNPPFLSYGVDSVHVIKTFDNTIFTQVFSILTSSSVVGLIILGFYFLAMVYLPSLIYQLILNQILGDKWRRV